MKQKTTLILLANGSRAHFYSHPGPKNRLIPHRELDLEEIPLHARDIQADKPGRTHNRMGANRHAMEYPTDPQSSAETRFLTKVIERANKEACKTNVDRFVVVAPPGSLGKLRNMLLPGLRDRLYGELTKDLTQIAPIDLPKHLAKILAV